MSPSAKYHLFLYSDPSSGPNVGILKQDQPDAQAVRLQADLVEVFCVLSPWRVRAHIILQWVATPPIGSSDHSTVLGVGPYRYTTDSRGVVIATNVGEARGWFITPGVFIDSYV